MITIQSLLDTLTGKNPFKRELDNVKNQNINDFKLYKDSLSTSSNPIKRYTYLGKLNKLFKK